MRCHIFLVPDWCAIVRSAAWLAMLIVTTYAQADDDFPTASEVEQLGLVVHWHAQTERSQTGTGQADIALWPHSTLRKQVISIKVGDRIVERIDADDIDVAAIEKLVYSGPTSTPTPRLGMESARAMADKIIARYATLGKKAEKIEIDQPITFLVAASNDGAVQALNAETGETLWSNAVGDYRLPTLGPGVNDNFVTLVNGMDMYVFDLAGGSVLGKRRLSESPSAPPQPIGPLIYVPGILGSLIAFDGQDLNAETISLRFTGMLTAPVVASQDGRFIAWPNKNHIYIAQAGRRFSLWSRVESSSTFRTMPQLTQDGFIAVATNGMVYRLNLNRTESIRWRGNLAAQVTTPPLVARGLVMVVSDVGDGYAVDEATGEVLWTSDVPDLSRILSITERRVYAQRKAGQLVAIDRSTGKAIAKLNRSFAQGILNTVNDRIILRSLSGQLICLREPDAVEPIPNLPPVKSQETLAKAEEGAKSAAGLEAPAEVAPSSTESLFGDPSKVDGAAPAMSDDPFGTTPGTTPPSDPLNPFGT